MAIANQQDFFNEEDEDDERLEGVDEHDEGEGSENHEDDGHEGEEEGTEGEEEGGETPSEPDGGEGESDGEGSATDSDDDREAIRARRREERKLRKQRAQEREERFRRELAARDTVIAQMQQQLGLISRKNFSSELGQLDSAINQAASAYEHFKNQLSEGTKAGDGDIVADATEKMYQARQAAEHYSKIKQAILSNQNKPQAPDARVQNHAKNWCEKNKWYDPSGKNIDSRITLALDDALAQEGYDPSTEEYWNELSNRVKKYLPHRAPMVYNDNVAPNQKGREIQDKSREQSSIKPKPRSVVTGSGKESSAGRGEYQISAERKQALVDAGLWDDPKQRNLAIKNFKEYDRVHGKGKVQ